MEDDLLGEFFSTINAVEEEVKRDSGAGSASKSEVAPPDNDSNPDPNGASDSSKTADETAAPPAKRRRREFMKPERSTAPAATPSAQVAAQARPAVVQVVAASGPQTVAPVADMAYYSYAPQPNGNAPSYPSTTDTTLSSAATGAVYDTTQARMVDPDNPNALAYKAPKKFVRSAGGQTWEDPTLSEWPENDFRLFVGDLGADVTVQMLEAIFRQYPSFAKTKICRDRARNKVRQFGFVSFLDGMDCMKAMREQQGKYCGQRPMKIRRSTWKDRDVQELKKKDKRRKKFEKKLGLQ